MVQPCVNAFGNQARTTACLPRYSDSLCVLPSVPCSVKSGAMSPTFTTVETAGAAFGAGAWAMTVTAASAPTNPIVSSARIHEPPGAGHALERVPSLERREVYPGQEGFGAVGTLLTCSSSCT